MFLSLRSPFWFDSIVRSHRLVLYEWVTHRMYFQSTTRLSPWRSFTIFASYFLKAICLSEYVDLYISVFRLIEWKLSLCLSKGSNSFFVNLTAEFRNGNSLIFQKQWNFRMVGFMFVLDFLFICSHFGAIFLLHFSIGSTQYMFVVNEREKKSNFMNNNRKRRPGIFFCDLWFVIRLEMPFS